MLSFAVAARALVLGIFPPSGAPALVIHLALGAWFAAALFRLRPGHAAGAAG